MAVPCRAFARVFAATVDQHPGAVCAKVDVEAAPALAGRFGVVSVPTVVVLCDGQPVRMRAGGWSPPHENVRRR